MRPQVRTTILVSALGLSVALNVSLGFGLVLRSRDAAGCAGGAPARARGCLLDDLNLSSAQRARLSALRREIQVQHREHWRRTDALKTDLADAISAERPDRGQIDRLLGAFADNQTRVQRAVVEHLLNVMSMLDREQRGEFRKLLRRQIFRRIGTNTPQGK
jgi:Spy/CpxP family protein refolding chaperone